MMIINASLFIIHLYIFDIFLSPNYVETYFVWIKHKSTRDILRKEKCFNTPREYLITATFS